MISTVTLKSDAKTSDPEATSTITLDRPSVVTLQFGPEEVTRFDRVGNDLVLLLQDGRTITIIGFFVTYDEGRNDIVFMDENGVTWWGQYAEPWDTFQIAEIERDFPPAAFGAAGLTPLLGLLGLGAAAVGAGGTSDAGETGGGTPPTEETSPVAGADTAEVKEAGIESGGNTGIDGVAEATGNVLANDTTTGMLPLHVTGVSIAGQTGIIGQELQGQYGVLTLNADGNYSYVLDNDLSATQALAAGVTATEVFSYEVTDASGGTDTQTLTISVEGTNDRPLISGADNGAVIEDVTPTATGQLTVSDVDQDDTHIWSVEGSAGSFGTLSVDAAGQWTYALDNENPSVQALSEGQSLNEVITVRVTDAEGGYSEQDINIGITGRNDPPFFDLASSTLTGAPTEITDQAPGENSADLTVNGTIAFSDIDQQDLDFSGSFVPAGDGSNYVGSFSLKPAETGGVDWEFTVNDAVLDALPEGEVLTQVYSVTVTDPEGETITQLVTITIVGRNDRPVAVDDSTTITSGQIAVHDVLANDSDVDTGDTSKWSVTEVDGLPISEGNSVTLSDDRGTVSLNGSGELSFTPGTGFSGVLEIPYTVNDGSGAANATAVGTWTITNVSAVVSDNASPTDPDGTDDVLSTVDDLDDVVISGQVPSDGTITEVTISDGTTTITVPADDISVNPDGTFTASTDVSGLSDGTLTTTVTVVDNTGTPITVRDTIAKDTVTDVAIDPVVIVDGVSPAITGTGQPGDTITLVLDGRDPITTTVSDDGTWTYTATTPVLSPEVTVSVTAQDPFGNTATDERLVASFVPTDDVDQSPAHIAVSEAGLPNGSDPQSGSATVSSTLVIGTTEGAIDHIVIGGTQISVDQLENSDSTPITPIETQYGTLTITAYDPVTGTISYSYALDGNTLAHSNAPGVASENDVLRDTISLTVVDNDADSRTTHLIVDIADDVPVAINDVVGLTAGDLGPVVGNVITVGAGSDVLGSDGGVVGSVEGVSVPVSGSVVVAGVYGDLTISADGSYSYTRRAGTEGGVDDTFSYTLVDGDGDTSTAVLTVQFGDAPVSIRDLRDDTGDGGTGVSDVFVNESRLGTGTQVGAGAATASGSFTVTAFDGIEELRVTADGGFVDIVTGGVVADFGSGPLELTSALGSRLEITGFDAGTGEVSYTYTLLAGETHAGAGRDAVLDVFGLRLEDQDGTFQTETLSVRILDDVPVITPVASAVSVTADEGDLSEDPFADFSTLFAVAHGADGAAAGADGVVYSLEVSAAGVDSGVHDVASGDPVVLYVENGVIVGRVGAPSGAVAFEVSVDAASGVVTLDQRLALSHGASGADVTQLLADVALLRVTAQDGDGDTATQTAPIGDRLRFEDDVPQTVLTVEAGFALPVLETQDADTLAGVDTATADFSGAITVANDAGSDGVSGTSPAVLSYGLGLQDGGVAVASVASGLSSEGQAVTLYLDAVTGVITGSTAGAAGDVSAANTVFTIAATDAGVVTLSQHQPIDHGDTGSNSEAVSLAAGLVVLTAASRLTDGDGDVDQDAATAAIGDSFVFTDDGPVAGPTAVAAVDEAGLRGDGGPLEVTRPLTIDMGADREAGPVGVGFDAAQTALEALGLESGTVALVYTVTDGAITARAGAGGDVVFTVTLDQPTAANGYQPGYSYVQDAPLDHPAAGAWMIWTWSLR